MSKVGKIIKIDNSNGKEKLSFIPYKQNFSFSIDAGNTLEFKTRNSIQSLYYEQSLPRGNVTVQDSFDPDPGPTPGLTALQVGKKLAKVVINPNAKSVEEIATWLNGLDLGGQTAMSLAYCTGGSDNPGAINVSEADPQYLNARGINIWIDDSVGLLLIFSPIDATIDVPGGTIHVPKGWSVPNTQTMQYDPITEITEFALPEASEIILVSEQFAFLNGVVIGAVYSDEELTPFEDNMTIRGVKVDPTKIPAGFNSYKEYFQSLTYTPPQSGAVLISSAVGSAPILAAVRSSAYEEDAVYFLGLAITSSPSLIYTTGYFDRGYPEEEGWWQYNTSTKDWDKITEETEYLLDEPVEIGEVKADCAPLNNVVFGAIVAEPGPGPQPSGKSLYYAEPITGIEINPSGLSTSALNSFLSNLGTPGTGTDHLGSEMLCGIGGQYDSGQSTFRNSEATIGWVDRITTGEESWGINALMIASDTFYIYYAPQDIPVYSDGELVLTVPQGWSVLNQSTMSCDPITVATEFALKQSLPVVGMRDAFETLNGTCICAVKEAVSELTQIAQGQTLRGIIVKPDATPSGYSSLDELITSNSKIEEDSDYTGFKSTNDYVGDFVLQSGEYVKVTDSNKDTLGIVPGTTIAYEYEQILIAGFMGDNGPAIACYINHYRQPGSLKFQLGEADYFIYYNIDGDNKYRDTELPQGWCVVDAGERAHVISDISRFDFAPTETLTMGQVESLFSAVNGVVFGAVTSGGGE